MGAPIRIVCKTKTTAGKEGKRKEKEKESIFQTSLSSSSLFFFFFSNPSRFLFPFFLFFSLRLEIFFSLLLVCSFFFFSDTFIHSFFPFRAAQKKKRKKKKKKKAKRRNESSQRQKEENNSIRTRILETREERKKERWLRRRIRKVASFSTTTVGVRCITTATATTTASVAHPSVPRSSAPTQWHSVWGVKIKATILPGKKFITGRSGSTPPGEWLRTTRTKSPQGKLALSRVLSVCTAPLRELTLASLFSRGCCLHQDSAVSKGMEWNNPTSGPIGA